jgi:hypothetical protein
LFTIFLLQFRDFSLTPYAPAPAPAPAHAPAAAPASAPASGSADPGHTHGLEASEKVPIISSLDEWLKQPAQIDIQEVHQRPHFFMFANTIIMSFAHTHFSFSFLWFL